MTRRRRLIGCSALAAAAIVAAAIPAASVSAPKLIPIRFAVITSAGQNEVPQVMRDSGIGKRYGFDVQLVPYASVGGQYLVMRAGAADVAGGNFVDLIRQRAGGLDIKGFLGFQTFSNLMTVPSGSSITSFKDLRGKRIAEYGPTTLDWLIMRTAGKKAYGLDIGSDAKPISTSPVLENQLISSKQADAAFQFSSLTLSPLADGTQKVLMPETTLLSNAGYNPKKLIYLVWMVTDSWVKQYPNALPRLRAAMQATYKKLRTDNSVWPGLAKLVYISDPKLVKQYRDLDRRIDDPPFSASQIRSTQKLVNDMVKAVGKENVGITKVDPKAFLFPNGK